MFTISGCSALIMNAMRQRKENKSIGDKTSRSAAYRLLPVTLCLLLTALLAPATHGQATQSATTTPDFQSVIARQAALVTEFEVNGLKVLIKRREGSQTVAAGLFIRGGAENISATNAGVEAFMLNVASEASANFPRDRMRKETARIGTVIGEGVSYDYSSLSMAATRA